LKTAIIAASSSAAPASTSAAFPQDLVASARAAHVARRGGSRLRAGEVRVDMGGEGAQGRRSEAVFGRRDRLGAGMKNVT
jgi:hypothetical protein